MTRRVEFVNGIPTVKEVSLVYYDESVPVTTNIGVAGTGYDSTHKIFTLPNAETYDGTKDELEVTIGGVRQTEGVGFTYGAGATETTITTIAAIPNGNNVDFRKVST